jgi:hypothetical protein
MNLKAISTSVITPGKIRVTMDLTPEGLKRIIVAANTPEGRDWALRKLESCLPQLERLEESLLRGI